MNYSCVALLLAAACGTEQAACPGASSDGVACTADICDQATNQWVHVPDNGACGSDQVCTLTGCADSALTGSAFLFGHDPSDPAHDDSGITVTLLQAGDSGSATGSAALTVTTAADGSWSIGAEPGTYTVQYTKAGYYTATTPGVVVAAISGGVAPAVTLSRSQRFNGSTAPSDIEDIEYTPSHTAIVETAYNAYDTVVYATPLDGNRGTVSIAVPTTDFSIWDDSLTWSLGNNIWSVPLNGSSRPCIIGTAITSGGATGAISVVGTPKTYAVLEETDPVTGLVSLWTAKTDCSVSPPTAPAWSQTDTSQPITSYYAFYQQRTIEKSGPAIFNDDQTVLVFTTSSVSPPPAGTANVHRIDFATNTSADVPFADPTYAANDFDDIVPSPDGNHVSGTSYPYFPNCSTTGGPEYDDRGFMADITAATLTTPIAQAPNLGSGALCSDESSDYTAAELVEWAPDSSGAVYATFQYDLAAGGTAGGGFRFWKAGSSAAVDVAAAGAYDDEEEFGLYKFYGNQVVGFYDVAGSNYLVGTVDGTEQHQIIDSAGLGITEVSSAGTHNLPTSSVDPTTGALYLAWEEPTTARGTVPNIVKTAAITPSPLAATVTTLGSAIDPTCTFQGTLSNDYFYELCTNNATITAFPPSSATSSGQYTGAYSSLYAAPAANAIAFEETDGRIWGATNGATFGSDSLRLVASPIDDVAIEDMSFVGQWLVYYDTASNITRVSNVGDSGVIDEPVASCDGVTFTTPTMDNAGSNLWFPAARCTVDSNFFYRTYMTPTANLP